MATNSSGNAILYLSLEITLIFFSLRGKQGRPPKKQWFSLGRNPKTPGKEGEILKTSYKR